MLAYVYLLAFIGFGSCSEIEKVMPSRYEIESSINRTIEEVEKMVRDNPSLPKLNRNDIVNILYNITAKDMHSIEDETLEALQKTREDYQRALMVVLPYKAKDSEESLKELYTKPPMVHMVADEASDPKRNSKIEFAYNPSPYSTNTVSQSDNLIENKHQLVTAHMRFDDSQESKTPVSTTSKVSETTTTTTAKTFSDTKPESAPQKFTFNLEVLDQRAEASHTSIATKRPIYKGTFSRYRTSTQTPPRLEIIYSTTMKTTTTTDAKVDTTTVENKPTQNVLSSDQWRYNAPPTTTTTTTTTTPRPYELPWRPMSPTNGYFVPTVLSAELDSDEANFANVKMEDFQKVMETTTSTTIRPAPIFVTPNAPTNEKQVNSNVKVAAPNRYKLTTTTVLPTPMREEVQQLLKSIGLQPMKTTKSPSNVQYSQNNVDTPMNVYLDSKSESSKVEPVKADLPTALKGSTFNAPQSAIKDGVQNLSPDIQLLFQQFGLQIPGQEAIVTTTTIAPKTTTSAARINSYTHFKPLPTSSVKDKDFRNFLARFGLGESRNQKSMQSVQVAKRPSLIDIVPGNMRKILENIGLIKRAPKVEPEPEPQIEFEIQTEASKIVERTTQLNEHIFKPHENVENVLEQKEKIQTLLNTVKMVQEGRANVEDVQKVAHDLLQSTKSLGTGPDPLKLEEILNNYRDSLKNEVKRQQQQTPATTTTTAAPTTELDESTLSTMATTDSSGSFSELSESSTSAPNNSSKASKTDQSSSSSTDNEKTAAKPNFFDSFDINEFLNNSSSTTVSPSGTTSKPSFFDTIDLTPYINNATNTGDSGTNLSDLEASFGGSTAAPDPVLPTRPKTGLYFLLDWNSFLEVGEEGKEKVNLRFQPKVGDRTRFIPVKIP